jgi:uncharacterized GH25 family protein
MHRALFGVLGLLALAAPASAHFPWIVPSADGSKAMVVFSDTLDPDKEVSITKLKGLKLGAWAAEGEKGQALQLAEKEHAYEVTVPKGLPVLGGVCHYGVVARGKGDPFLLVYHPKAIADATPGPIPGTLGKSPNGEQAFEIVVNATRGAGKPHVTGFTVLFRGKPLPDAEVVVMVPGVDKHVEGTTDKEGGFTFTVDHNKHPGLYGVRARHVEKKEGKFADKEYREVRHYATLVFRVAPSAGGVKQAKQEPHPDATKLLAVARANRATWDNFPGFTAEVEVNTDGVINRGTVVVDGSGKVQVTMSDKATHKWALSQLQSVVSHRLVGDDRQTPCAFADIDVHHPLGRKINVLNDELHSSYRIRGVEIVEVNRKMGAGRFTITVLESQRNAEKKLLSTSYVVNTWDGTDKLVGSQAFHQTWVRVGRFDLPGRETIINAGSGALGARTLTLTDHKLLPATQR